MLKEQLLELNFTPNQADVYLALLDLGQTKVGAILKSTGFHRNIVYRALEDLEKRKLVYKITKRGVAYFEATDPRPILDEIDKKKELAGSVIKEIKNKKSVSQSETHVYTGFQGIQDLCESVIDAGEDVYLIGSNGFIDIRYPEYFAKYNEKRIKKNITIHHLAIPETAGTDFLKPPLLKVRFLPTNFASPLVVWIFSDTVAQVLWEQPETIFVVKNKKIANNYREYFKLLWKQSGTT